MERQGQGREAMGREGKRSNDERVALCVGRAFLPCCHSNLEVPIVSVSFA